MWPVADVSREPFPMGPSTPSGERAFVASSDGVWPRVVAAGKGGSDRGDVRAGLPPPADDRPPVAGPLLPAAAPSRAAAFATAATGNGGKMIACGGN